MDALTYAQLNTHHCRAAMAHLSIYLAHQKVDILFIQEPYCYIGVPSLIPPYYTPFYVSSDTGPRACLLIKSDLAHKFILIRKFSTPDNVIVSMSTTPILYLSSTYLPPYDTLELDLAPMESFLAATQPLNLIWGMDSNSKHSMWHSPVTDTRGRRLVEFLSSNSLITVNEKDGPTFSGALGDSWIDITATTINIAHKIQNWQVSEEETHSDHNLITYNTIPLHSHSNITRQPNNSTRKFATQVGRWKEFEQKIQQANNKWLDNIKKSTCKDQLDGVITTIWEELNEINSKCFPPFMPTNKYVPWWSPELKILRKQVNAAKRRIRRCKNPTLKVMYKTSFTLLKNNYKAQILKAKLEAWKIFCTESSRTSPWKIYKSCKSEHKNRDILTTLITEEGSATSTPKETAEALLDKFFPDDNPTHDNELHRNVRTQVMIRKAPTTQPEPEFANHEVEETIKSLKDKKLPGPDGIDGTIVKKINKIAPKFWNTLFNKCLSLGCFPKVWKKANVIAIPKADRSKLHLISGYRGISLLSIPGKCLEKLAMDRLNYFLQSSDQIQSQQYGFTTGKSTADAITAVTNFVYQNKRKKLKSCLLTLDIAGAFDNAWHPGLLDRLWNLNCPSNIFNLISDFLQNRTTYLSLGNANSAKQVTKGCPQGSVSGPTLWNIIISGLIKQLDYLPDLEIVIYADDIMLMFKGQSHSHILATLQNALEITENWCNTQKLKVAVEKSALMPMYIRKKDEYLNHHVVTTRGLKVVSKMKYLGVMLDNKMDWYPHTQFLENKLLKLRNSLIRCSKASWGLSYHNLLTIYKHAILPVVTYAAEAWYNSASKRAILKIKKIQRSFLIIITKAYKTVSNEALQAIAGIMPIDQAILLSNDIKATNRGLQTNAVIPILKNPEIKTRCPDIHPKDNHIAIDDTGTIGQAEIQIYTDGSKTDMHVGTGVVAVKNSKEIYIEARRLGKECSVFQAELLGISIAVDWIKRRANEYKSYAIHVDSKAALFSIANKYTTQPIAVNIRKALIELRNSTYISLHWVRGHSGIRGNERADYLAKIVASHKSNTEYTHLPRARVKQILENYYINIWNATYINSCVATYTKPYIPSIFQRLSLSLWPNYKLTQFLTNHGSFRSYLYKINKAPSPNCNCSERPPQTAQHLLTECSTYSRGRPAVLTTVPLHKILQYYINTKDVTDFISYIFSTLQE